MEQQGSPDSRRSRLEPGQSPATVKNRSQGRQAGQGWLPAGSCTEQGPPRLGCSNLPLNQVSERQLWEASNSPLLQLPTSPNPLAVLTPTALGQATFSKVYPLKSAFRSQPAGAIARRSCLKIHKQDFLGQISSYSPVTISSANGDCYSTGARGGGVDFPNILGHRSGSERTDQIPPRSLWS